MAKAYAHTVDICDEISSDGSQTTAVDVDIADEISSIGSQNTDYIDNLSDIDATEPRSQADGRRTRSHHVTLSNIKFRILEKLHIERKRRDEDPDELESTLLAKVVAVLVAVFCGVCVGFAAFMEASACSHLHDCGTMLSMYPQMLRKTGANTLNM